MSVHDLITNLSPFLGYKNIDDGTCRGFTLRWIEACILDEEDIFETRINKIVELSIIVMMESIKKKILNNITFNDAEEDFLLDLHHIGNITEDEQSLILDITDQKEDPQPLLEIFSRITHAAKSENLIKIVQELKIKVKNQEPLNLPEKYQDIPAFYESQQIFQSPDNALFQTGISQDDIELISKIASSKGIEKRGFLSKIYTESSIYTKQEIKDYFKELGNVIESSRTKESIGILLGNTKHTIGLTYTVNEGWRFKDINQESTKPLIGLRRQAAKSPPLTLDEVVEKIMRGFNSPNQYVAFHTQVLTSNKNKQKKLLTNKLKTFKAQNILTKEIALREERINLAYLAAYYNDVELLGKLAFFKANLNFTNLNGETPTWIAAQNGWAQAIEQLAITHANLNAANKMGQTPVWVATYFNEIEALEALIKHGANLNTPNDKGESPLHIAAKKGYFNIVHLLCANHVDLNVTNKLGETPTYSAAKNGNIKTIIQLKKFKPDLNESDNERKTPAWIAACNGHVDVIAELGKHQADEDTIPVDFNISDCFGKTPAWIAACNGHLYAVKELIKHEANWNQADKSGITPLQIARQKGHVDIVKELEKQMAAQPNTTKTSKMTLTSKLTTNLANAKTITGGKKRLRSEDTLFSKQDTSFKDEDAQMSEPQEQPIVQPHKKIKT